MSIRFGNDGHLTLVDLSGTNEVAVAKTTIPLVLLLSICKCTLGLTEFYLMEL
jgi:hypothetical protein